MKKLLLYILSGLCALSCVEPVVITSGSISGVVKDSQSNDILKGVKVTLSPGGASQLTDKDGTFSFDDLEQAEYTLSFVKDGYKDASQKVSVKAGLSASVQVSMAPLQPVIKVNPEVLDFGESATSQAFDISNVGKGTLKWKITEEIDWLSCSESGGETTNDIASIAITVDRSGLGKGAYSETIVVSSNGGSAIVKVKMAVGASASLTVEPSMLDFGEKESSLQVKLANPGKSSIKYRVSSSSTWLTFSKTTGTVVTSDYFNAIVTREGLAAGKYDTDIVISTDDETLLVPVKMEVSALTAPTVTIENVADVTYNSASVNGTLVSVGSSPVSRYGFCYGTSEEPTVDDNIASVGNTSSPCSFNAVLVGLESSTKYYCRAFAENNEGIAYSTKIMSFTTHALPEMAVVVAGEVSEITETTAVATATITSLGNVDAATAHGHVWNTTGSPTVNDSKTDLGKISSLNSFKSDLTELEPGTTYYVRAYAVNTCGTAYSDELTFTTKESAVTPDPGPGDDPVIDPDEIVVPQGLMSYYTFDNEDASDLTENELDGTLMNDPSFTSETASGKGKALNLNGVKEQYMTIPYNVFKSLTKYSISFWIKDFSQGSVLTAVGVKSHSLQRPKLILNDAQKFEFNTETYSSSPRYTFPYDCTPIMSSSWHHVVVSTEDGLNTLYVDGMKVDAIKGYISGSSATKLDIGGNCEGTMNSFITMKIDNVRLYQRTITEPEVRKIYENEGSCVVDEIAVSEKMNSLPVSPLAYYSFDDKTVGDVSGNGKNGVLSSNPGFMTDTPDGSANALRLNAFKNQYVCIPYPIFNGLKEYSASMWIKDFSQGCLFSMMGVDNASCRPRLLVTDAQKFEFNTEIYSSSPKYTFAYDCTPIMSSSWHHIVVSTRNGLNTLYVDGVKVDEISAYFNQANTTKLYIGGDCDGILASFMGMKIDNVSFYDVCLTEDNVKYMYDNLL